jgi:hypothetical protein
MHFFVRRTIGRLRLSVPQKADINSQIALDLHQQRPTHILKRDVRFTPESGHWSALCDATCAHAGAPLA